MDRTLIAILGAGVVVVALTPWLAWPAPPKSVPPEDRRFLHCPNCLKESIYSPKAEEDGCKRCGPEFSLVATKLSLKETGPAADAWATLVPVLLVEFTLLLGAVLGYVYFARQAKKEQDENYLYTDCRKCHQRLRYSPEKIGKAGLCPRCRYGFVFPQPTPDELLPAPWWKDWKWLKDWSWIKRLWRKSA